MVKEIEIEDIPTEMSRIVNVIKLEKLKEPYSFCPTMEEKQKIAQRLDILTVQDLNVSIVASWRQSLAINHDIKGMLNATVIQKCVITNHPVSEEISEFFEFRVCHSNQEEALKDELDAFEDIEFTATGDIDIGEIAIQYLILALNPYPKIPELLEKESSSQSLIEKEDQNNSPIKLNPFSVLEKLKQKSPEDSQ